MLLSACDRGSRAIRGAVLHLLHLFPVFGPDMRKWGPRIPTSLRGFLADARLCAVGGWSALSAMYCVGLVRAC